MRLQKEIEIRQSSLLVAQRQEQLSAKRMEHALDDRIDWIKRQNKALQTEITVVELEYGKLLSSIDLIRELGGGFCDSD